MKTKAVVGALALLLVGALALVVLLWAAQPLQEVGPAAGHAPPSTALPATTTTSATPAAVTAPSVGHSAATSVSSTARRPPSTTTTTLPTRITLAAVGDILPHMPIVRSARDGSGSYDFTPVFGPIAPYLQSADYTVANLETRLAGGARGFSGYPLFNSPDQLALALAEAGIDLVATANNHSLDMGLDGVVRTLTVLEEAGVAHAGTHRSVEDRDRPVVVDIKGIRLAFLNYTAGTNGIPLPAGHEYAVDLLHTSRAAEDVTKARLAGAELVVALLHFGEEYQRQPNDRQRQVSRELFEAGVDLIVGTHPHVVQPIEKLTIGGSAGGLAGGSVSGQAGGLAGDRYVIYSTGNFVSNQYWRYSNCGIVAYVHIERSGGVTAVKGVQYLPVYVQRGWTSAGRAYRVLPAMANLDPASDLPLSKLDRAALAQVWSDTHALLDRPGDGISALQPADLLAGRR